MEKRDAKKRSDTFNHNLIHLVFSSLQLLKDEQFLVGASSDNPQISLDQGYTFDTRNPENALKFRCAFFWNLDLLTSKIDSSTF